MQDHLVQGQIRHGTAQTSVFGFEFLEAFDLNGRKTAKLLSPSVVGDVADAVWRMASATLMP